MAHVVEREVFDFEVDGDAIERHAGRFAIVGKDAAAPIGPVSALFLDQSDGVIARQVDQRDALVVSVLCAWVFSILDQQGLGAWIVVIPSDPADFVLPHSRSDREPQYPAHRNRQPDVRVEIGEEPLELLFRRPAVALLALSNQSKMVER